MENSTHLYLRSATTELHKKVEQRVGVGKMRSNSFSPSDYYNLLQAHLSVTRNTLATAHLLDDSAKPFTQSIKLLLTGLELDLPGTSTTFRKSEGKAYDNKFAVFGAYYVILGATNGSKFILPWLEASKLLVGVKPFHYFQASVGLPVATWRQFTDLLNQTVTTQRQRQQCLEGAHHAFRGFVD